MNQPLIGNSGGVRPKETKLEILAGIEGLVGTVEEVALPVCVLFLQQGHDPRAAPASRLINVPGHFDGDDVTEFSRLDIFVGLLIAGRAAGLGANRDYFSCLLDRIAEGARVFHGVGGGFFHVGVAAGLHGFHSVQGMLKVGGGDDDGVDIFAGVELVVVADTGNGAAPALLLDEGSAFVTTAVPDIRHCYEFEVKLLGVILEGRHQGSLGSITCADQGYANAVVGAGNCRVTGGSPR